METRDELLKVYQQALSLVSDREGTYKDGWKEDTLEDHLANVARKARAVKILAEKNGNSAELVKHQLLDLINYSGFSLLKMESTSKIRLALDIPPLWLGILSPLSDVDFISAALCDKYPDYLNYYKDQLRSSILNCRDLWAPKSEEEVKDSNITSKKELLPKVGTITGSVSFEVLDKVVEQVEPDWILSPDVFRDHNATLSRYTNLKDKYGDKLVGVVQADSDEELEECFAAYGEIVAIPYDIGSKWEDPIGLKIARRIMAVQAFPDRKVHLLGLTSPLELLFYKDFPNVISFNTGLPIKLAFEGKPLLTQDEKVFSSLIEEVNYPVTYESFKKAEKNIRDLRSILSGKIPD